MVNLTEIQTVNTLNTLRGRLLLPNEADRTFTVIDDGVIQIEDGRISAVRAATAKDGPSPNPNRVWMPGLVDTHLHFPQTQIIGSAAGPLLDWLQASVFPEEARFNDPDYARVVAETFCDALIRQGTTCASVFSSSNAEATQILFEAFANRGLRGQIGLTLMDRGAPEAVLVDAESALKAARALAKRWHGHDEDRLRFCVTPRFALSCTPALLKGAGKLARELNLPIQTHLSENDAEIEATLAAFPEADDYFSVYERADLANERSIFAHCIHLSDGEWGRVASRDCAVAHCPDSNFFLGSGQMPLRKPLDLGVRVGLGTDMGAGRTFSMRRVAASAYDTSLLTEAGASAEALLWLATLGGSRALNLHDKTGRIAVGYEADLVAFDIDDTRTGAGLFDALAFQHDSTGAAMTLVRGRLLKGA